MEGVDQTIPVDELAAVAGGLPSRVLAAVADRAVFAPETADPADAERMAQWAAGFVDAARSHAEERDARAA